MKNVFLYILFFMSWAAGNVYADDYEDAFFNYPYVCLDSVLSMPSFPGGDASMATWVENNKHRFSELPGVGRYSFIVGADGKIVLLPTKSEYSADEKRFLLSMPKWHPAVSLAGNAVDAVVDVKVDFRNEAQRKEDERLYKQWIDSVCASGIMLDWSDIQMCPRFPGGDNSMYDWIEQNLVYPEDVDSVKAKVVLSFVVRRDGYLRNIKVERASHPAFGREAVRMVEKMSRWVPAMNKGVYVDCSYVLPVVFNPKREGLK